MPKAEEKASVTTSDAGQHPSTSSGHEPLGAFVGRWKTEGRVLPTPSTPALEIAGEDSYEWLPGGYALLHRVDVTIGGERVRSVEMIGPDAASGTYLMHSFDARGNAGTMRASERGGAWTFAGDGMRFTGRFGDGGGTLSGRWERLDDASEWVPWMDVTLTRTG